MYMKREKYITPRVVSVAFLVENGCAGSLTPNTVEFEFMMTPDDNGNGFFRNESFDDAGGYGNDYNFFGE